MTTFQTVFSEDRRYRYTLWREWDLSLFDKRFVQFICLNPSTADEKIDDPTVRKCIAYAKAWGYGAMCMTNLFAYRSTDPKDMKRQADPVGPDNDQWILGIHDQADLTICAWGNHGNYLDRAARVLEKLAFSSKGLCVLKLNRDGSPAHPLYLKMNLKPIPGP